MRSVFPAFAFAFAAATTACATTGDDLTDEVTADETKSDDYWSELRVRAGDTTLWMDRALARRDGPNGPEYVLHGRTSRNIESGRAFVFDDVYGDFAQKTARTFDVTVPVSVARTLVDGVPEFIGFTFLHSTSRPDSLTARAIVRPRLVGFTGASSVYLTAELTPVVRGGVVVYRIKGTATSKIYELAARAGDVYLNDVRLVDDTHFEIDLQLDHVTALAGVAGTGVEVEVLLLSGSATKQANLALGIKKLGLTSGDVEEVWPPMTCTDDTRACLGGLPDGTIDLAACGEAIAVNACAGQVGVFVDDVVMQATLAAADARVSSAAFRSDAQGLVGADRADEFEYATKLTVEDHVVGLFGRWYLSPTARDAALAAALETGIDAAYARPMDLVEPHQPAPGNAAATRQVAADALLAELATHDFRDTEFQRPLEELARVYRSQHVADIRAFRETIQAEDWPSHPEWQLHAGSWLGAYIEVTVVRATGVVDNVLVEID